MFVLKNWVLKILIKTLKKECQIKLNVEKLCMLTSCYEMLKMWVVTSKNLSSNVPI